MNIGDVRWEIPEFGSSSGIAAERQKCRVVYIHPERRFYTVEFRSKVTGLSFRQSYQMREGTTP